MGRRLIAALCASLLLCAAAPLPAALLVGRARITDGDTLRIGNVRVRLFGIDAPEMDQSCNDDRGARYACGRSARDVLAREVGNAVVSCQPVDRDQYGRVVARCSALGEDLNGYMVASGWAVAYREFSRDYVAAEEAARAARRGMWSGQFMLPSQWRRQERRER